MKETNFVWAVALSIAACAVGCTQILGLDGPYVGGGGKGGNGGGSNDCVSATMMPCYSGDAMTQNLGNCKSGTQTCVNGAWGMCLGEVLPSVEACNGTDDDCDGTIDNGCSCSNGATQLCYSGSMGTQDVGLCKAGTQTCAGGMWGACVGQTLPTAETCNGADDDCDAVVDNGNPGGGMDCAAMGQGACAIGKMVCTSGGLSCEPTGTIGAEDCTTLALDENCDGESACTGMIAWSHSYGGQKTDHAYAVDTDASNNVVIAGDFQDTQSFGAGTLINAGGSDVLVLKLGPKGDTLWSKGFGSPGSDIGSAVAVDGAGNIYVAGTFGGPIDFGGGALNNDLGSLFVTKLSPNGAYIWSKAFTGAQQFIYTDIAVDPAGNIVVTSTFQGNVDFGGGMLVGTNETIALFELSADGNHLWSKAFGTGNCCGNVRASVATDKSGNVGLVGRYRNQINFGGSLLPANGTDVFIAKFDKMGAHLWSKRGTGGSEDTGEGLAFMKNGDLVISGTFNSNPLMIDALSLPRYSLADAFIASFSADGTALWGKPLGPNNGKEEASELAVDNLDNIVFTGSTDKIGLDLGGGPLQNEGPFLVKFDNAGTHIWSKSFNAQCCNYPVPFLTVDKLGSPILVGATDMPIDFGTGLLPVVGNSDIFVAKFAP